MSSVCPYNCTYKTEYGYCRFTGCIIPKYNSYRDTFEHTEDEQPITAYGTGSQPYIPVYTYPITYIADECIEKIADAVVRKMAIFNCGEDKEEYEGSN